MFTEWLKNSVLGIIILGVIGTFLAALLLFISRPILTILKRRLGRSTIATLLGIQAPAAATAATYVFLKRRKQSDFRYAYMVGSMSMLAAFTAILPLMALLNIIYFAVAGKSQPYSSVTLVVIDLLYLRALIRQSFASLFFIRRAIRFQNAARRRYKTTVRHIVLKRNLKAKNAPARLGWCNVYLQLATGVKDSFLNLAFGKRTTPNSSASKSSGPSDTHVII